MCCCTLQDFQCIVYFVGWATEVPFWPFKIPKQPHNYIRSTSLRKFSKEDHHWKEKRRPEQFLSPGWYFVHPEWSYDNYPFPLRRFTIVMWRLSNMAQFFVYYNSLTLPITLAGNRSQTNCTHNFVFSNFFLYEKLFWADVDYELAESFQVS